MLLSMPLIAERLAARCPQGGAILAPRAHELSNGQLRCLLCGNVSERPTLRGVRLAGTSSEGRDFDEAYAYVIDARDYGIMVGQNCPRHAIVVGDHLEQACASLPGLSHELLAVETGMQLAEVIARVAEVFATLSEWDGRMLLGIAENRGVGWVLEVASEQLSNPIALFDSSLQLVARAGEIGYGTSDSIWDDVLSKGFSPVEFYTREEQVAVGEGLRAGAWPAIIRPQRTPGRSNLFAAVTVGDRPYGSIGQVDLVAPFTSGQVALAEHVRNRLQQTIAVGMGSMVGADELLYNVDRLLGGEQVDGSFLAYHLRKRGWSLDDPFRVLYCPCGHNSNWPLGEASRKARIEQSFSKAITLLHGDAVVCIVRAADHDFSDGSLPRGLSKALSSMDMTCIVSEEFGGLVNARFALQQCVACSAVLAQDSSQTTIFFRECYEDVAVRAIGIGIPLESACHPKIMSLVREGYRGDIERGRELVRILYGYLVCGRNARECSRRLFMHRNTLAYRVGLLEKHLGCSLAELDDAEVIYLELSCLIASRDKRG